jgi:multiple sugar transport system ATP-binding protein
MNTIWCRVTEAGGALALDFAGSGVSLPDGLGAAIRERRVTEVVVGVRPEHLRLASEGLVPAMVTVVESLGHERHVVCRLPGDYLVIVRQAAEVPPPAVGAALHLATDAADLHVFDAATGERIGV